MGCNYYARKTKPRIVKVYDEIHLGKSSWGWKFCFKEHDEIHSYEQFVKWLENNVDTGEFEIRDEYDRIIPKKELLKLIAERQESAKDNPDNFEYCKNIDGYRFSEDEFS